MKNKTFFTLFFLITLALSDTPIDLNPLTCAEIPTLYTDNLQYLWNKTALGDISRYAFIIMCPLLIIAEVVLLLFIKANPKILGQPAALYCVIIGFELLLNLHYLGTSIYFTVYQDDVVMPSNYPSYCMANALLVTFFETLHFVFLLMVPLYIVYILRRTLKSNARIWTLVYIIVFGVSVLSTYFLWQEDFLGLNIYGLCALSFIRTANQSPVIPVLPIISNAIFVVAGVFTIQYYNKHMPNSLGLRKKRHIQKQILRIYVFGYSFFWLVDSVIDMLLYFSCQSTSVGSGLSPFITIRNILDLVQCFLIFIIIFKIDNVRTAFKKYLKRIFSKRNSETQKMSFMNDDSSSSRPEQYFNFEEVLLDIKVQRNQIDILKISQVVTLVSGIYIAYKQYYNILDHQYFNPYLTEIQSNRLLQQTQGRRKKKSFRTTKKIYFHQKMSIKITDQITKQFICDLSLLPKLGILQCTMIIHAPKVFQIMLESDNLAQIYESFQLKDNTRKMFDIVEGQGGRSGEFFFFSNDNKYVLKTITQEEFEFIDKNLLYFYQHFVRNPHSVLAKIYGLFTLHGDEIQRTYHLILMKNILACRNQQIVRTYDMKGSTDNRQVNKQGQIEVNQLKKLTLKDLDFVKDEGRMHIDNQRKLKLREIIMKDTMFLKGLNLLDYSLLVVRVKWEQSPDNEDFWGDYQRMPSSIDDREYYHIGIIDYLQRWDLQKKGQKWWKNLIGKKDVSAQEPKKYQQRFMSFITEITKLVPSFGDSPNRSGRDSRPQSGIRRLSSNISLMKSPLVKEQPSSGEQWKSKLDQDNRSEKTRKRECEEGSWQYEESNQSSRFTKGEERIIEIEMQPKISSKGKDQTLRPLSEHFAQEEDSSTLNMRSAYTIHQPY